MISAVTDHVWQSTLFALLAALATIGLRRHRASTRYWIWFTASLKFLIPFSLLVSLGGQFRFERASQVAQSRVVIAAVDFGQQLVTPTATALHGGGRGMNLVPIACFLWVCGMIAVVGRWYIRWRRIRAAVRN